MTYRRAAAAFLCIGALTVACRSQLPEGVAPVAADSTTAPATYNVITAQQLADAGLLGNNAYLAVQRLRPAYLIDKTAGARRSSQPIMISVNGGQLSPLSELNAIPASTIAEIRFLTVGEASQRFRSRNSGPVILVTLMSR